MVIMHTCEDIILDIWIESFSQILNNLLLSTSPAFYFVNLNSRAQTFLISMSSTMIPSAKHSIRGLAEM